MLSNAIEQRFVVKFLMKLGQTATQTYKLLKGVYGRKCLSRARVFDWFKRFQDGREDVEDDLRSGRPSTSKTSGNIKKVGDLVRSNKRLSIREIAEITGIDKESVRRILQYTFNIQKICNRMVPKALSFEQQEARDNFCTDTLNAIEKDADLLERIITCDDSWFYVNELETKRQSIHRKNPSSLRIKKPRISKPRLKVRIIVFFDSHGIVHYDWIPEGETFNQNYYLQILAQFHEKIREKRPKLWEDKSWVLYQNKGPAYSAFSVKEFLAKYSIPVLDHPLCSPDLAPSDFFLFTKVKCAIKGKRFKSVEAVKEKVTSVLTDMTHKDFQYCFQQWKVRMECCKERSGAYIEGEQEVVGDAVSECDEKTNINLMEIEDTGGLSEDDSRHSDTAYQENSTNQELDTKFSEEMFNNSGKIKEEPSYFDYEVISNIKTEIMDFKIEYDSKNDINSKESIKKRMDVLSEELADLKARRQQQENEINNIDNMALKQRLQDIIDNLLTEQLQKEHEYEELKQLLEQE